MISIAYVHTRIHTYTHIYIHTYIHTYMLTNMYARVVHFSDVRKSDLNEMDFLNLLIARAASGANHHHKQQVWLAAYLTYLAGYTLMPRKLRPHLSVCSFLVSLDKNLA